MLKQWLSASQQRAFLESRRDLRAFACPSLEAIEPALFDWAVLGRVLETATDVLVTRAGALLDESVPRDVPAVRALFACGAGVVVRHAQTHEAGLERLAQRFASEFAAEVHIQLFVTPGGSHGFGWHYDPDDVVILQTLGRKNYYFRANTQVAASELQDGPDFTRIARESSPLLGCTLHAGDALYLPRGIWHMARATEDALSISLGLEQRARGALASPS